VAYNLTSKILAADSNKVITMQTVATTKMSSKGQVVIPETIRNELGLSPGDQFVVVADGDVVIFKTISPPPMQQFDKIVEKARQQAEAAGMTEQDIEEAIRGARKKR